MHTYTCRYIYMNMHTCTLVYLVKLMPTNIVLTHISVPKLMMESARIHTQRFTAII